MLSKLYIIFDVGKEMREGMERTSLQHALCKDIAVINTGLKGLVLAIPWSGQTMQLEKEDYMKMLGANVCQHLSTQSAKVLKTIKKKKKRSPSLSDV